jgi:hypothetical protein
MAYGPGDATIAATTADEWLNDNILDLYASHSPFLAQLQDTADEPGGEFHFKAGTPAEGGKFKIPLFGKVTFTADGVTRANQINAISPTINDDVIAAFYNWAHYQGIAYHNYEDMSKNSGKAAQADLGQAYVDQVISKLNAVLNTDLFDGAADSADKILAVNYALANSGTMGGIDQTDAANNAWWQAQQETTAEPFTTYVFDIVRDLCTIDTPVKNGVRKIDPDMALFGGNLYAKLRQELKASQRIETGALLRGGAKYIDYDGCRCYRNPAQTSTTVLILNTGTWAFRYKTKAPEPVTEGYVPVSGTPSMWQRGFNWMLGLGCMSPKHNGLLTGKTA